jgi:tetratricopeptide (TPR) repeat protein
MKPVRNNSDPDSPRTQKVARPSPRTLPIAASALGFVLLVAGGSWFLWHRHTSPPPIEQAKSDYVDPAVCATCHDDIAATYRKTGMGRSFYRPTPQNVIEDYVQKNTLDHKSSGMSYTMVEHDGNFFQRRHTIGFDGKETNVVEQQVDYIIGSGNHARTYLHRTPQGKLTELPVSWYTKRSGSWAMSPGYDSANQEDIRRTIPSECMFCHNGYPRIDQDAPPNQADSGIFPANLPEGIDCQRCHGPGRAHVAAARSVVLDPHLIRTSIVNPGKLPRDRQLEVCMQCHLETSSRNVPNEIRAYDRGVFSYRPGQPLGDYKIYFDRAKDAKDDTFEVAHAAYRLRQSKCFLNSDMTCLTCHDPHNIPRGAEATKTYIAACENCHHAVVHRVATPAGTDCISCHMPKRRTEDAVHLVMTDHFIRRYQPQRDLLAPIEEKVITSTSPVIEYYPPNQTPSAKNELYLAVAKVNDGKNAEGLKHLQAVVTQQTPSAPEPYVTLGRTYADRGDNAEAVRWFEAALKQQPDNRPALRELGTALLATHQDQQALETLQRAITLYPNDDMLLTNLGNVYLRMNRPTEAQTALDRAVTANPQLADAYNLLGLVALQTPDKAAAEKSFREAIRWQPNLAEAQSNLATLLTGNHEFEEAKFHFTRALAINPDYADAHHGLGLLLILTNSIPEATAELREAVRLQPTSAQNHDDLADVLAAQGQTAQAAEEYKKVLQLKPDQSDAQLGLGLTLLQQHKIDEAKLYLQKAALSPDPDQREAAANALSQIGH